MFLTTPSNGVETCIDVVNVNVVVRTLVFGASMYDVTVHESRDRLE